MNALLDTHAVLWAVLDPAKLGLQAADLLSDPDNRLFVSPASYWEIAIKISRGKFILERPYEAFWKDGLALLGATILPIELRHTSQLLSLPFHHKDPFDRLLIAQALAEGLPLVSADPVVEAYGVQRIW